MRASRAPSHDVAVAGLLAKRQGRFAADAWNLAQPGRDLPTRGPVRRGIGEFRPFA
jgi:hypothetical protein